MATVSALQHTTLPLRNSGPSWVLLLGPYPTLSKGTNSRSKLQRFMRSKAIVWLYMHKIGIIVMAN